MPAEKKRIAMLRKIGCFESDQNRAIPPHNAVSDRIRHEKASVRQTTIFGERLHVGASVDSRKHGDRKDHD
ncbi:MAG TPA: hypothetical protein VI958_09230 [Acidobacteriota bacterium]